MFHETELILSYAGLGNSKIVHINGHCISRALIRIAIFTALLACLALTTIICVQKSVNGISAILFPIGIILTYGSLSCQYATFVWKVVKIAQIVDYAKSVVDQSE